VHYQGIPLPPRRPDADGGLLVQLPVFDLLNTGAPVELSVTSRLTGRRLTTTFDPIPTAAALWATSTAPKALTITGADTMVSGRVHSNADLTISGARITLPAGAEYVTQLHVTGAGHVVPSPRQVAAGGLPATIAISDYRPGGARAVAAGARYHVVPASECRNRQWSVAADAVPAGVVYVPCAVTISGAGRIGALVVAEGPIHLSGARIVVDPGVPGMPALVTAAAGADAIMVAGADASLNGAVQALDGGVRLIGSRMTLHCGAVAGTIALSAANATVIVDADCRAR
jgi:hypothetical protein